MMYVATCHHPVHPGVLEISDHLQNKCGFCEGLDWKEVARPQETLGHGRIGVGPSFIYYNNNHI